MPKPPACTCGACSTCVKRNYMRHYLRRPEARAYAARKYAAWYANPANAEKVKARARRGRQSTPIEKKRAQDAVQKALKRGALERPTRCGRCAAECKPIAHHHDYAKPLEIEWLCRSCHSREHSPHD